MRISREATLSSKGQATIPKAVRDRLQIKPGDRFKFFFHPDGVIILPKISTKHLKGSVPGLRRPVSLNEIDQAVVAGMLDNVHIRPASRQASSRLSTRVR